MTTLGENITAIGVEGKFDDCQALVKQAFADRSLDHIQLTSANSINIGRLLPQAKAILIPQLIQGIFRCVFRNPQGAIRSLNLSVQAL